jgi:hypothetical protein
MRCNRKLLFSFFPWYALEITRKNMIQGILENETITHKHPQKQPYLENEK